MRDKFILISSNKDKALINNISKKLDIPVGDIDFKKINGQESGVFINTYVNNKIIYFIYNINQNVNNCLMDIFICIDLLKKNGAKKINLIIPYLPYSEIKDETINHLDFNLIARFFEECGVNVIYTFDLYVEQLSISLKLPFYNISLLKIFSATLINKFENKKNLIVTSIDRELQNKAKDVAKYINCEFVDTILKSNKFAKEPEFQIHSNINNKDVLIIGNIINSGLIYSYFAKYLTLKGAKNIYAIVSHGIFSDDKFKIIENSIIKEMYICTSQRKQLPKKIKLINTENIITELIERAINNKNIVNFIK